MPTTILVVEDDKFLRELIAQKLIKENYEVSEAVIELISSQEKS